MQKTHIYIYIVIHASDVVDPCRLKKLSMSCTLLVDCAFGFRLSENTFSRKGTVIREKQELVS